MRLFSICAAIAPTLPKEVFLTPAQELIFRCDTVDESGRFLIDHTGYGQNLSPKFMLENLSPAAKALAITPEDLSHPIKGFTHWVIRNIPAADKVPSAIPAGRRPSVPANARQGLAYGFHRYAGSKPPKGASHPYRFTLYALDSELPLTACATKRTFLRKAQGHILQKGEVTGSFRKP